MTGCRAKARAIFWLAALCLLLTGTSLLGPGPSWAQDSDIAVVVSSQIRPYVLALEGLRTKLDLPFTVYYLNANPELARRQLQDGHFSLVVAIGPEAARMAWSTPADTPKMALMVLDPEQLLGDGDWCGIDLRIPIAEQLAVITSRLGPDRKIGILYNPEENQKWVEEAVGAAQAQHTSVVPLPVHGRDEIAGTLAGVYNVIDTLFFIPDSTVISEALLSYIVKEALLHGIAVVGYNHFFIEIGAVLAFSIDYERVGEQGAALAQNLLTLRQCVRRAPPFHVEWNEKAWQTITERRSAVASNGGTP